MTKRVLLGGTFDGIHLGHQKLLDTAFEIGDEVTIGLVTDKMLKKWKPVVEKSFEERKAILKELLNRRDNWSIVGISDPYSRAIKGDYDTLVVSWETAERGKEINRRREKAGKSPLELKIVKPVLADDLLPISSTRIRGGIIDVHGKRLVPVRIHTYTEDLQEISVIKEVMERLMTDVELETSKANNIEETTLIEKAKCKAELPENYDYGIGIESGILESEHGPLKIECAVIKDNIKQTSIGFGPGFLLPRFWPKDVKEGVTLVDRIKVNYNDDITQVDVLTERRVGKRDCMRSALLTAMIPRMSGDLFLKPSLQDP